MRISESTIRRIIRQEATRALRSVNEAAFPEEVEAVYGTGRPEDWEDAEREAHEEETHGSGRDPRRGMGGAGHGWFGGYDESGLIWLDSGDDEVDERWEQWALATKSLLAAMGNEEFPSEGGDRVSVGQMMIELIKSL